MTNASPLRRRAFAAIRWTSVSVVGRSILQLLQITVVARFLSPAELGVMALVIGVIAMAQVFSDIGLSTAIIHFQDIRREELSSLYWLNVGSGAVLTVAMAAAAPALAAAYGNSQLVWPLAVSGTIFFVSALGQQLRVVAIKRLLFARLALVELASALSGFGVIIGWLWVRPGVMALVGGLLASAITTTVLLWVSFAEGWRPSATLDIALVRRFLRFGGFTTANSLVNALNRQSDVFIGGMFLAPSGLGLFSLPRDLTLRLGSVVNAVATQVGLPIMAIAQNDQDYLRSVYLKTLCFTASVNFPVFVFIGTFSHDLSVVIFGAAWAPAGPVLSVMAAWGALRSAMNPVGSLVSAVGRPELEFKWNLALLGIIPLSVMASARFGVMTLALSQAALMAAFVLPHWYYLVRPLCASTLVQFLVQLAVPLVCAIGAAVLTLAVTGLHSQGLLSLAGAAVLFGLAYLTLSAWLNRPWLIALKELLLRR